VIDPVKIELNIDLAKQRWIDAMFNVDISFITHPSFQLMTIELDLSKRGHQSDRKRSNQR